MEKLLSTRDPDQLQNLQLIAAPAALRFVHAGPA
jgi:hypothetical protein